MPVSILCISHIRPWHALLLLPSSIETCFYYSIKTRAYIGTHTQAHISAQEEWREPDTGIWFGGAEIGPGFCYRQRPSHTSKTKK